MFREDFRGALRGQVEAIPLPPEATWTRKAAQGSTLSTALIIGAVASAVLVAFVISGALSRTDREGGVLASPPVRPTTAPGGARVAPVPNAVRNEQYSYNLVVPAWFLRTTVAVGPESAGGLLYREYYTARTDDFSPALRATSLLRWDLIVEVWDRGERDAAAWAPTFGCDRSPDRAALCDLTTTTIQGTPAVVATLLSPVRGKVYLVERGEYLIALRYGVGSENDRPEHVNEETLDGIVRSLGLP